MSKTGAQLLSKARIQGIRLPELPVEVRPKSAEEAYACQRGVVQGLVEHYGGELIGYKIACTNVTAQQQLNVDGPFHGRLLSAFLYETPARVPANQFFMRVVEAEFAFLMARDLPSREELWTREEVADAVAGVIPGIEIVDSRFDSWTTIGAMSLIADNACNAAWVRGKVLEDWRAIDLAAQTVRLTVNGKLWKIGNGKAVLGHPLTALEWLANSLSASGQGLKAGQYVTTGVTMEVYMGERGDKIVADFGPVGTAELEFS